MGGMFPFSGYTAPQSRTVAVPAMLPRRRLQVASLDLTWPEKSASDILDFVVDPTNWLLEINDRLKSATAAFPAPVLETDFVVLGTSIINGMIVLYVAGGAPLTSVPIVVTMQTVGGRTQAVLVNLLVNGSTGPAVVTLPALLPGGYAVAPNAMILPDGKIATDNSGRPYLIA